MLRTWLLSCALIFCAAKPCSAESLYLVETRAPGAVADLVAAGVVVARDFEGEALVFGGPAAESLLRRAALDYRVLERDVSGREQFVLWSRDAAVFSSLDGAARVLDRRDGRVIVSLPAGAGERALGAWEAERVFPRAVRPDAGASARSRGAAIRAEAASKSAVADPAIAAMVAQVTADSIGAWVQHLQNYGTRQANRPKADSAAAWIASRFESFGIDSVYLSDWSTTYAPNVVATIPGVATPERIVVIGAHFDSYTGVATNAPGADDNASGTAGVLEIARALAGHEFSCTIQFVTFSAEEYGLYGSEAFASAAAARGDSIVGMLNLDMIGYRSAADPRDLDLIVNGASAWMSDLARDAGALYVPGFSIVDGYLTAGTSDHQSFWANGYPAIFFFEDSDFYSPYIHTANDVVGTSYVDAMLAQSITRIVVASAAMLADPFDIVIAHTPLANTTDTVNPYTVAATIRAAAALEPDSLRLWWETSGSWSSAPLAPSGGADMYEAAIPAQPGGTWASYYITAADVNGARVTHPADAPVALHRFFVGTITTVWADDLEAASGWTIGAPGDNATAGIWERGDPQGTMSYGPVQPEDDHTAAPGVNCFATGLLAGASSGSNDVDNGRTTVTSPPIDLSAYANASLAYWRWFSNDLGSNPGQDAWRVDVTNDGATWVAVENTTVARNQWTRFETPLAGLVDFGAPVQFRFVATDDLPGSLVEAAFDDVAILVYQEQATDVPWGAGATGRLVLGANQPNPFNPSTAIAFALPSAGRARLAIFDVSGRLVRVLVDERLPAGEHRASWNGNDASGTPVASGVYLYQLRLGGDFETRRMMLVR